MAKLQVAQKNRGLPKKNQVPLVVVADTFSSDDAVDLVSGRDFLKISFSSFLSDNEISIGSIFLLSDC